MVRGSDPVRLAGANPKGGWRTKAAKRSPLTLRSCRRCLFFYEVVKAKRTAGHEPDPLSFLRRKKITVVCLYAQVCPSTCSRWCGCA